MAAKCRGWRRPPGTRWHNAIVTPQQPSVATCVKTPTTPAHPTLRTQIVCALCTRVPHLLAIYAFGSRVKTAAHPRADSDLDLAILVAGWADPLKLFDWAAELADLADCAVDLLDLRAASTVMQHQILTTGERWWALDAQAALFEAAVLSEKTALDALRAPLLADIAAQGVIYGR